MKRSKARAVFFSFLASLLLGSHVVFGQAGTETITQSDAKRIKYLAQEALEQFQEALNFIVTSEIPAPDFNNLIKTSYSQGAARTFYDSSSVLVQDLEELSSNNIPGRDEVSAYLNDFNIFTVKESSASVVFSNFRVSEIKRGTYLYLQIAYDCQYNCKSLRMDKVPLEHKIAEFRVYKDSQAWKAYITTVSFFNPSDSAILTGGGIELAPDTEVRADTAQATTADTTLRMVKPVLTEEQKEQIRRDNEAIAARKLTDEGDTALIRKDLFRALKCFTYAQKIDTSNAYLRARIANVNQLLESQNITPDKQYDLYIQQATLAKGQHRYDEARVAYDKALTVKPSSNDQLRPLINELTAKALLLNRIRLKMGDRDFKGALEICKTAVTQYPSDPVFLLRRARAYEAQNDAKQARKDYSKAVDMEPGYLEAYVLRGAYYERIKDFNSALSDYTVVAQLDKSNDSLYLLTAVLDMDKNDVTAAIGELDKGLALNPERYAFQEQKGELLYEIQRQPVQAQACFSAAIALGADSPRAWYYRGLCENDQAKVDDAARDFAQARILHLEGKLSDHVSGIALGYYVKGNDAFSAQKGDEALTQYSNAILIEPNRDAYRLARGNAYYFLKGAYADAADNYTQAVALNGKNDTAYQQRGMARYSVGIFDQAVKDMDSAIQENAQVPERYYYRGQAHLQLKDYEPAIKDFDEVQARAKALKKELPDTLQAALYDARGECYFQSGNTPVSLEQFKTAVKFNKGQNPAFLFDLGKAYLKLNQLKDAQANVSAAVARQADNALWDATLGDIDRLQGNYVDAFTQYSAALKADPTAADALHQRAVCQSRLANYQGALADMQQLQTMGTDVPGYADEVGGLYVKLNRPDSAVACFAVVLAKDSLDADALYGMGVASLQRNQKEEALQWLGKALATGKIHKSTVKGDKALDPLKDDKAFRALLKKYSDQMPK